MSFMQKWRDKARAESEDLQASGETEYVRVTGELVEMLPGTFSRDFDGGTVSFVDVDGRSRRHPASQVVRVDG